ncbi:MAG: hypothetical protein HY848_21860, partial [Betaproteobacteria bacterium]|nr:hypothetical protein [Betaproteobacteria bacterium]
DNSTYGLVFVFIQDRRLRADVLFIRAQSTIRADGPPSAQVRSLQLDISLYFDRYRRSGHCALARANRVFGTDKKHIRTKNTVMDKSNDGLGFAFIQDRRLRADVLFIRAQSTIRVDGFSSAQNCNSAATGGVIQVAAYGTSYT